MSKPTHRGDINAGVSHAMGRFVQRLGKRRRRLLSLYYLDGVPLEEAAKQVRLTLASARQLTARARLAVQRATLRVRLAG
jgi:DNA-directed RNA polymerase specialized sigma24 family protein